MPRGIIALVFRCKITGGHLATNDEVTTFHWADQNDIRQLLIGNAEGAIGTDVAGAHDSNFISQMKAP